MTVFLISFGCTEGSEVARPGCDSEDPHHLAYDSAGVSIVESYCPILDFGWTVEDSASLEIGGRDVELPEAFSGVRLSWALRLTDGRLVVQDRGTSDLRYFLPTGAHLRSVGGHGDGPGEFRDLWESAFWLPGDSVAAYDFTLDRLTILDEAGDVATTASIRLPRPAASIYVLGRLRDGTILTSILADPATLYSGEGVYPSIESVWRADPDGIGSTRVLDVSGQPMFVSAGGRYRLPFSDSPYVGVWDDQLVVGDRSAFEFRTYDLDGGLELIVRREFTPRPVLDGELTDRHAAEVERLRRAYLDAEVPFFDRMFERPEIPRTHSAFDAAIVDRVGNLWVGINEAAPGPGGTWRRTGISRIWSVFDPEGVWITDVRMPEGLRVTDIGEDYVLGVAALDRGVPVVRLYSLNK